MGATGAPGERSLGSANVLDVETHDSVVTLRRDGEVSRGLKAFIQSWNRSLNVLIAPHYAGLANQHTTPRRRSKQSGETPALFALGELLQLAVSLLAADQLILPVRQGKGAVSHNACADKQRQ